MNILSFWKSNMNNTVFYLLMIFCAHIYFSCKHLNSDTEKMLTLLPNDESPKVLSAIPGMGDTGLPRSQKIVILFDKPMNVNSCVQSFSIAPNTQGYFELTDYTLTFTPSASWNYGTYTYTLTKNCESKSGSDLREIQSASFSIGEAGTAGSYPALSEVLIHTGTTEGCNGDSPTQSNLLTESLTNVCMGTPIGNAITFRFSRPMDKQATMAALAFSPSLMGSYTWISDTALRVLPDFPFVYKTRIHFNLSTQSADVQGIKLQAPVSGSFYVGTGNLLPMVTSLTLKADTLSNCLQGVAASADLTTTAIANACLGNPTSNPIRITFSRAMNQIQTQASITISPNLTGTYSWSTDNRSLTFVPDVKLSYGTRYTVSVGTGAVTVDRVYVEAASIYSFAAGGRANEAPTVQAIGVASQGCATSLPGTGNALGGNWLSGHCFWDHTLPLLSASAYQFRAGDSGNGSIGSSASCADSNTDNFRIIFSNYMDLNQTVNAIRLRRLSPPGTILQLASWNWEDCQSSYPYGCRVINLIFSELEASCNGSSAFGNASTLGDFNLLRSDDTQSGYPFYMITVDTTARDVLQVPLSSPFHFSMEAK